ncbi:heterokaryon incompatibility protein-domain-containing protein [Epithele typhae]|uniref:heterokaryon incompatibility protein-domain-containing protein n=1 Tax=Epithele typhae TaxID=378194 RepID=UPI002008C2FF|nr:heterokaryon incompatibility protein-domain-containing protein [Epithele typhae]KAH9910751.1 heterokaryon incompatibility protein-domain-containing protein [Epithele typhae]
MWLLGTARANLVFFPQPEDVPGGYAILSHTWEGEEETFQKVQKLNPRRPSPPWFNPRDRLTPKVRSFLELAEKHGYEYAWVDTCCINKESSAELSEGINSMFRYYALSRICCVYLSNVGYSHTDPFQDGQFKRSKWQRRGWTLQELIAARFVVFYSSYWICLGTKYELADRLEEATGISAAVLRFESSFADASIATRISWAAHRETTRPEDGAYSLFGLFGVNMPTLYGEGRHAFCRLLMEISKTSRDPSIFLLGTRWYVDELGDLQLALQGMPQSRTHRHLLPLQPSPRNTDYYGVPLALNPVFYKPNEHRYQREERGVRWYGYCSTLYYIDGHFRTARLQVRPKNSALPRSLCRRMESSSTQPFCL